MSEAICIYHKGCMDGIASAHVVKRFVPGVELVARNYGEEPPDVKGKLLYIVDFSFPVGVMERLRDEADRVLWMDHHKTAVEIREAIGWGTVDLEECGATLTWRMLSGNVAAPEILDYIKDRDLWQWKLENSREVSEALKEKFLSPSADPFRKDLLTLDPNNLVERGTKLLKLKDIRVKVNTIRGFEVSFHGHKTWAVNCYNDVSEVGQHIYEKMGYPIALMFWRDQGTWICSLRSKTVDVSQLAKKHGGGGHVSAAGFHTQTLLPILHG